VGVVWSRGRLVAVSWRKGGRCTTGDLWTPLLLQRELASATAQNAVGTNCTQTLSRPVAVFCGCCAVSIVRGHCPCVLWPWTLGPRSRSSSGSRASTSKTTSSTCVLGPCGHVIWPSTTSHTSTHTHTHAHKQKATHANTHDLPFGVAGVSRV